MALPLRPLAFVLAATNHGSMIVNRNDYKMVDARSGFGVGFQLLNKSSFDEAEVGLALALLDSRRRHFGDGVETIDGGANIGVHTIEWARHMHNWGRVTAFEAQEHVYYALAGNIAINNAFNARAHWAALGDKVGEIAIPKANPLVPGSFGSLELRKRDGTEDIGQKVSYAAEDAMRVRLVTIDSLDMQRCDFFKLDVEGMEAEVLKGAIETLKRCKPVLLVEVIKSDRQALEALMTGLGYQVFVIGMNALAVHASDPTLASLKIEGGVLTFNR